MGHEIKDTILVSIVAIAFFLNITVINLFPPAIKELVVIGYILLAIGLLFFVLSVLTLHKKSTRGLVNTGVYGVVRHPMYLGGIVMFFSHVFFSQNWILVISTTIAIVCCYLSSLLEDQRNIKKFGGGYKKYMQKVPRMNLLLGIVRMAEG